MGTTTSKVRLSCNHRPTVVGTPDIGDKVICPRCTELAEAAGKTGTTCLRTVKSVDRTQAEPTAANERDAAEARIAELREAAGTVKLTGRTGHQVDAAEAHLTDLVVDTTSTTVTLRGTHADLIEVIRTTAARVLDGTSAGRGANVALNSLRRAVEADAEGNQPVTAEDVAAEQRARAEVVGRLALVPFGTLAAAPEADELPDSYDPVLASQEYRELKAWAQGGKVGPEPTAVNWRTMMAAHAGGNQQRRSSNKKATSAKPRTSARRAAANKVQAEIGFEGRKAAGVVKWSDEELAAWIRKVVAEHPDTRKEDELEQAYWVERVAVSRSRFYRVWAEATAPEGDAPAE